MKLRDANLQLYKKKLFRTFSFMYFAFIFPRVHHDYFFRRAFEKVQAQFLSGNFFPPDERKVVLLVIYLFNYDSSKSIFFMLNMAFDALLSTVFIK